MDRNAAQHEREVTVQQVGRRRIQAIRSLVKSPREIPARLWENKMRKSILVLAAIVAAGTVVQSQTADARGLRVGFGYGMGSGGLSPLADSSILERARRQQEKNAGGGRSYQSAPVQHSNRAAERRRAAALAVAAAAERRNAAAQARADKIAAERQAARAAEAAAARRKVDVVKAPVTAPVTSLAPAVATGDKALEAAQQEQRAKAEELLRKLNGQPAKTAEPSVAPVVVPTAAPEVAPQVKSTPARIVVAPAAKPVAAPASTGECRRFIPGAGVTVSVSCSE